MCMASTMLPLTSSVNRTNPPYSRCVGKYTRAPCEETWCSYEHHLEVRKIGNHGIGGGAGLNFMYSGKCARAGCSYDDRPVPNVPAANCCKWVRHTNRPQQGALRSKQKIAAP